MGRILDTQRESLRRIRLDIIEWREGILDETPHDTCRKLDAPRLRRLKIDFDSRDLDWEAPDQFGPGELRWLRQFLSMRAAEFPRSKLGEIVIVFESSGDCVTDKEDDEENDVWPWHYLDKVVEVADLYSVSLTYTSEALSWEEYYSDSSSGSSIYI